MVGGHHRLLRNMTPRGPSSNSDMEVDMDAVNTSRLSLRPVQLTDLEELYALSRMPEVNLFNPSGPDRSIDEARERLEDWLRDWETDGIGYCTARMLESDAYVGYVGLAARTFRDEHVLNLAYRIRPEFQGSGLVTEACRALIEAARPRWSGHRIRVLTKQDNTPSIAVATRLGFTHAPDLDDTPDPGDINLFLDL